MCSRTVYALSIFVRMTPFKVLSISSSFFKHWMKGGEECVRYVVHLRYIRYVMYGIYLCI